VVRVVDILRKKGLWDDIEVNGQIIGVHFETPLVASQGQKDVIDLLQHIQFIQGLYGPEAASAFYHTSKLSPWVAKKLGVNLEMIKDTQEIEQIEEETDKQRKLMMEAQANQQGAPAA